MTRTRFLGGLCLFVGVAAAACGGRHAVTTGPGAAVADLLPVRAAILRAEDRRRVDDDLLAALDHDVAELRAAAVGALGRIGDAATLPLVVAALADPAPAVRADAALAVGLLGQREALPSLIERAGDPDVTVRAAVADALGLVPDAASSQTLLNLMRDDDLGVVAAACFAAARFEQASFAVDTLLELGRRPEAELQLTSAWALSRLSSRIGLLDAAAYRSVRLRMLELAESPGSELRRLAAIGLSIPRNEDEAVAVGKLIEDPQPEVRIAAVDALSFPGAPIEPFLSKVLEDSDPRVVLAVVEGLGRMRGDDVLEALADFVVHDERLWLRERAVYALSRVSLGAAKMANGLSRSAEPEIRRATATLLRGRIDDENIEYAKRLLADEDVGVRAAIVPVLAEADAPLKTLLADVMDSGEPRIRTALARAAGRRLERSDGSPESRDEALSLLERLWAEAGTDVRLREAVIDAAAAGGQQAAVRALLERAVAAAERQVRVRAAERLYVLFGDDRREAVGPIADEPLEHYLEVLRWASRPRAAVVTVERPGFIPARFTVQLDVASAPLTSWHFAQLADAGFYDGLSIHRRIPNFVLQSGDPLGDGSGGPGFTLRDEFRPSRFWPGTLGLVSAARDRGGSQWFITLTLQPQLLGRHTAFGAVVQNYPGVVALLLPGDRVVSIRTYSGQGSEPLPPLDAVSSAPPLNR